MSGNGNSGNTPAACFQTLDVTRYRETLAHLHQVVGDGHGRIEVRPDGADGDGGCCVLISKAELRSLEDALEILSRCAEYKAMCDELTQVAAAFGTAPQGA